MQNSGRLVAAGFAAALALWSPGNALARNVIIFVADGLRSHSVTPETAPALAAVRAEGVDFQNSHSLYPTVTTPNSSAIATGHLLGDTGDFGNTIFVGQPLPAPYGSAVVGIEDDDTQGLMNQRSAATTSARQLCCRPHEPRATQPQRSANTARPRSRTSCRATAWARS